MEKESEKYQQQFSRLCHDAGLIHYQITRLTGDLNDLQVKLRNVEIDFKKAREAEVKTAGHIQEATATPEGVTQ